MLMAILSPLHPIIWKRRSRTTLCSTTARSNKTVMLLSIKCKPLKAQLPRLLTMQQKNSRRLMAQISEKEVMMGATQMMKSGKTPSRKTAPLTCFSTRRRLTRSTRRGTRWRATSWSKTVRLPRLMPASPLKWNPLQLRPPMEAVLLRLPVAPSSRSKSRTTLPNSLQHRRP